MIIKMAVMMLLPVIKITFTMISELIMVMFMMLPRTCRADDQGGRRQTSWDRQ